MYRPAVIADEMVEEGDTAPDFTAPLANGDVEEFELSERLDDEAPVVLAFFPGAFTEVCSHEMNAFQERLEEFEDSDATVYGVSVDSPFALNEFRDQLDLEFDLISDANRDVIERYGVSMAFEELGLEQLADRVVFVVDDDGEVVYRWQGEHPGKEPDYEEVLEAAEAAAPSA